MQRFWVEITHAIEYLPTETLILPPSSVILLLLSESDPLKKTHSISEKPRYIDCLTDCVDRAPNSGRVGESRQGDPFPSTKTVSVRIT